MNIADFDYQKFLEHSLTRMVCGVIVFFIFLYVIKFLKNFLKKYFNDKLKDNKNGYVLVERIISTIIFCIGCLVSFSIAIPDFSAVSIINILGITSVAIGFAFKDILQNFLSGILMLLENPFKIGDYIVADKYEGQVKNIKIRATILKTKTGDKIVIPNANLFTSPICVNNAYRIKRLSINIGIPYQQDPNLAIGLINKILEKPNYTAGNTKPSIGLIDFKNRQNIINVIWWYDARTYSEQESLHKVLVDIRNDFIDHGLTILNKQN